MADGKSCWDCLHRYTATSKEPCVHCFDVVKDKDVHIYWKAIDQQCELCEYATKKATEAPCDICYNRRTHPEFKQKECGTKKATRSEILTEANNITSGKRKGEEYGPPEDSFSAIAGLWSEYLDRKVKPHDVAVMMALVKIARIKGGAFKLDNWIDLAGYAACGGECQSKE